MVAQIFLISVLVLACIGLLFYMGYMIHKLKTKRQEEPIIDNLMMYEPPMFQ